MKIDTGLVFPKAIIKSLDQKTPIIKQGDVLTIKMADGEERSGPNAWGFLGVYFGGVSNIPAKITDQSIKIAKRHAKVLRQRVESRALKKQKKTVQLDPNVKVQRVVDHFERELETYPKPITSTIIEDCVRVTAERAEKSGFMSKKAVFTVLKSYLQNQAEGKATG